MRRTRGCSLLAFRGRWHVLSCRNPSALSTTASWDAVEPAVDGLASVMQVGRPCRSHAARRTLRGSAWHFVPCSSRGARLPWCTAPQHSTSGPAVTVPWDPTVPSSYGARSARICKLASTAGQSGLGRRTGVSGAGQGTAELAARGDAQLGEDLAQVILDRARAQKQPEGDLRVRQPLGGQPRDLRLLRRQLYHGGDGGSAGSPAGGPQLAAGAGGIRFHADRVQHLDGGAQLLTRVGAAAFPPQPLPVQQVGTGEFGTQPGAA